jgi:putative zinc finger/helix-turn-helix YgiT family protein
VCGSDQASAIQSRLNKRAFTAFKKRVDGLLEGYEIASLRAAMNLTQTKAAEIFGGGPVAFSKYENDDIMQSESMDTLIRLAARIPEAREWLFERPDKRATTELSINLLPQRTQKMITGRIKNNFNSLSTALPMKTLHLGLREATAYIIDASNIMESQYVNLDDNINSFLEKSPVSNRATRSRVYNKEENSRYELSNFYIETVI